jgi:hypothetical protein
MNQNSKDRCLIKDLWTTMFSSKNTHTSQNTCTTDYIMLINSGFKMVNFFLCGNEVSVFTTQTTRTVTLLLCGYVAPSVGNFRLSSAVLRAVQCPCHPRESYEALLDYVGCSLVQMHGVTVSPGVMLT